MISPEADILTGLVPRLERDGNDTTAAVETDLNESIETVRESVKDAGGADPGTTTETMREEKRTESVVGATTTGSIDTETETEMATATGREDTKTTMLTTESTGTDAASVTTKQ